MQLARSRAACGLAAQCRTDRLGVVRRWSRKTVVSTRAVLPGAEHIAATAASVHGLASMAQNIYTIADDAAAVTSTSSGGTFGFLADGFEAFLKILERGMARAGVPYSYGFAIILLTVLVKAATYPLSKKSMESTIAMQAVAPRVKELQVKYANEPEKLQLETATLYKQSGINPLAGCLPTLATIPVFIGLYRALTKAADEGLLTSGFFWIPSLGGPTSMASRQAGTGLSWLFPFENGQPPIGWKDAVAYLVPPLLLVVSQYVSQKIVSPKTDDPQQKQTQAILQFIPLMIGWFSLNVPSGLTLYWFVNNIISTAMQIYMKNTIKVAVPPAAAAAAAGTPQSDIIDVTATVIKPKEDRERKGSGQELGSRKKKNADGTPVAPAAPAAQSGPQKGQKFRARKSREAAAKAAAQAGIAQPNGTASEPESAKAAAPATTTSQLETVKVPDTPPRKD